MTSILDQDSERHRKYAAERLHKKVEDVSWSEYLWARTQNLQFLDGPKQPARDAMEKRALDLFQKVLIEIQRHEGGCPGPDFGCTLCNRAVETLATALKNS